MPSEYFYPLSIDEILRRILSWVACDVEESADGNDDSIFTPLSQSAKLTLTSAARVNKTFSPVALDVLYGHTEFESILHVTDPRLATQWTWQRSNEQLDNPGITMGAGDVSVGTTDHKNSRQSAQAVDSQRWDRLVTCSQRVRKLQICCSAPSNVLKAIFDYLDTLSIRYGKKHATLTLFPGLKCLEIVHGTGFTMFPWLERFLHQPLQELRITYSNTSPVYNFVDILRILAAVPGLRALWIDVTAMSADFLSPIPSLEHLKLTTLHLSPVSDLSKTLNVLEKLGATLQCAELYISQTALPAHRSPIGLPKLKVLYINGTLETVRFSLEHLDLPRLEKICVCMYTGLQAGGNPVLSSGDKYAQIVNDVRAISSAIARCDILRILELEYFLGDFTPFADGQRVSLSTLLVGSFPHSRTEHSSLETIDVVMDGFTDAVTFSDEDVENIAKTCPQVEDFNISLAYDFAATVPTFKSLQRLPELLPNLKELSLSIGPSDADMDIFKSIRNSDSANHAGWVQFPHVNTLRLYVPTEPYNIFDATISQASSPTDCEPSDRDGADLYRDTDSQLADFDSRDAVDTMYEDEDYDNSEDNIARTVRMMVTALFQNLDLESCYLHDNRVDSEVWNEVLWSMGCVL